MTVSQLLTIDSLNIKKLRSVGSATFKILQSTAVFYTTLININIVDIWQICAFPQQLTINSLKVIPIVKSKMLINNWQQWRINNFDQLCALQQWSTENYQKLAIVSYNLYVCSSTINHIWQLSVINSWLSLDSQSKHI